MRYTEEKLHLMTKPLSNSEEERVQHSVGMIKSCILESPKLDRLDIEIFSQGSYANNTNVKVDSDVDICVMCKSVFWGSYPYGYTGKHYGYIDSNYHYSDYKRQIIEALRNKFGKDNVIEGNKSVKIASNSYRVQADVVPAFMLKDYASISSFEKEKYVEGIKFISRKGTSVINYPKSHIENGIRKNKDTGRAYKELVRIMKNIKNSMIEEELIDGDKFSSFLIECLVWNVPNEIFIEKENLNGLIRNCIIWLYSSIEDGKHHEWTEVSGRLKLFDSDRKWSDKDVLCFLGILYSYMEFDNE